MSASETSLRAPRREPRKPMARAARVALFEREVRERLSEAAIEILVGGATVLSEGERVTALHGADAFFGSTMLTIDLLRAEGSLRERCDVAAARRIAGMLTGDPRVGKRLRELAEREAVRIAGTALKTTATDVRVRSQNTTVFVDVDIEATALASLT